MVLVPVQVILVALEAISGILACDTEEQGLPWVQMVEDCGGLDRLEQLQEHENRFVCRNMFYLERQIRYNIRAYVTYFIMFYLERQMRYNIRAYVTYFIMFYLEGQIRYNIRAYVTYFIMFYLERHIRYNIRAYTTYFIMFYLVRQIRYNIEEAHTKQNMTFRGCFP